MDQAKATELATELQRDPVMSAKYSRIDVAPIDVNDLTRGYKVQGRPMTDYARDDELARRGVA